MNVKEKQAEIDEVPYNMVLIRAFYKRKWTNDIEYYAKNKNDIVIKMTGLNGAFRLTESQRRSVAKFLLEGLKSKKVRNND